MMFSEHSSSHIDTELNKQKKSFLVIRIWDLFS